MRGCAKLPVSTRFAWGVLGEAMSAVQAAGGAIILTAVLMARPA